MVLGDPVNLGDPLPAVHPYYPPVVPGEEGWGAAEQEREAVMGRDRRQLRIENRLDHAIRRAKGQHAMRRK